MLTLLIAAAAIDPAALDRLVAAHLGAGVGEPGGAAAPVDRRLRLADCPAPPELTTTGTRGELVRVECPGGWRLFVRVTPAASARGPSPSAAAPGAAPPLVRRGQEVTLRLSGTGFSVTQPGVALEDGAEGAWVRARRGRDVVRGRVAADGMVALPGG